MNSLNHIYHLLSTEQNPSWSNVLSHFTLFLDQLKGIWEDDLSLFKLYSLHPQKLPDLPKPNGIPLLLSTATPPDMNVPLLPDERERLERALSKENIRRHNEEIRSLVSFLDEKISNSSIEMVKK